MATKLAVASFDITKGSKTKEGSSEDYQNAYAVLGKLNLSTTMNRDGKTVHLTNTTVAGEFNNSETPVDLRDRLLKSIQAGFNLIGIRYKLYVSVGENWAQWVVDVA